MDQTSLPTANPLTALEAAISKRLQSEQMPAFSGYLLEKITSRIDYEREMKALKPKIWAAFSVLTISLGLLVLAAGTFVKAFTQTQSFHLLALSFSDFGVMVDNWQDYTFSILENLPLGALALVLIAALATTLLTDFSFHQWSNFKRISTAYRH